MPLSTVLPAQPVTFTRETWYPAIDRRTLPIGTALNTAGFTRGRPSTLAAVSNQPAGSGNVGGDAAVAELGGRLGALITTSGTTWARGWYDGTWKPAFDSAGFNSGAFLDPDSVVFTLDFDVACTTSVFAAAGIDVTGFWFVPALSFPPNFVDSTPGAGDPRGGFGVALNDDGGGQNLWQFVSFDTTPNILLRTDISLDVTDWNTFRFVVVSADAGRSATLSLVVNGTAVPTVTELPFDDVTLFRPATQNPTAVGFRQGAVMADLGGEGWRFRTYWRQGRFTAAGVEVQGI